MEVTPYLTFIQLCFEHKHSQNVVDNGILCIATLLQVLFIAMLLQVLNIATLLQVPYIAPLLQVLYIAMLLQVLCIATLLQVLYIVHLFQYSTLQLYTSTLHCTFIPANYIVILHYFLTTHPTNDSCISLQVYVLRNDDAAVC